MSQVDPSLYLYSQKPGNEVAVIHYFKTFTTETLRRREQLDLYNLNDAV